MSKAAKLSNLAEETSGVSLQVDGQMKEPTQGAQDLWESEEDDRQIPHFSTLLTEKRIPDLV